MIADLKPYPEYKESDLPWLGQVPGHWEVRRLKSAAANVIEQTSDMNAAEVYVALEHVESWTGRVRPQFGSSLFLGQVKRFKSNDVLFGKLRPYLAKVTRVGRDGVCAGEFFVLRPTDALLNSAYLEHQLRAKHTIDLINGSTFGAKMPRADWQFCGNLPIPLPPPAEQAAIVRFLDWTNGRLERAIRAKRKVIALLNEQKQAIIHRAVTRGLDPSVPLKPSGIPWLGQIPAHWELSPNRAFLRVRKDLVGDRHTKFMLLSLTKRGVIVRDLSGMRGKFSSDMGTSQEVRPGDLVLCLFDVPETPRTVGLSHHAGMITGAYTVLESRSPDIAAFLELFYIAMDDRKLLSPLYSGLRNTIPKERFLGAKTPIPPEDERTEILIAVKERTASLNMAISRLEREIDLLREYRTRLVADVVTGKLDVRDAATRLPDEELLPDLASADDETDDLTIKE